ncbi:MULTISPECIES: branched-chain amino acid ABC transporter permease [Isoptericola]|uniref:Branched-chain amino acid ABC transporter permease n=1 Tax=Isoptericola haloaureus TaxID=1542902 RepID=A0ABU7Z4E7_9MICO|nr:branched-chain amino acid ABC transporter permease [Isoptericola sp. AK164]
MTTTATPRTSTSAGGGLTGRLTTDTGSQRSRGDYVVLAVFVAVAAAVPFVLSASDMAIANRVLIFAIMGVGWNIMAGFGGMFSFGHAAYFGIGAYATAYGVVVLGLSPWLGMLLGIAISVAAGVGISYLALRYKLTGAYYTMSTFAFAEALRLFVIGNDALNRTVGFTIPVQQGSSLVDFQFPAGSPWYYWIGLGLLGMCLLASILFVRSRPGRFTIAARDDDVAAAALGIDVLRHKLFAVAVSAAITAVAGTYYVQYYMFVDPEIAFGAAASNDAIITAVVGGTGTIWGPIVGAIIMAPLSDVVTGFLRTPPPGFEWLAGHGGLDIILYAVILVAVVILLPKGVYGTLVSRRRKS